MNKYFGTDGIRFIYSNTTKELIGRIGRSLASLKNPTVIIGNDTRSSGEEIVSILAEQLHEKNILYAGTISTPGICYLSLRHLAIGIMVTASHNPAEYNGIKIFENGFKLSSKKQKSLEEKIDLLSPFEVEESALPEIDETVRREYFSFLKSQIRPNRFHLAFDAGNGALSPYIQSIVALLDPEAHILHADPDGRNINEGCGSLHPEEMQNYLIEHHLDYGFSFDGDGDRIVFVTPDKIYSGDDLLYIFSRVCRLKKKKIVVTVCSNLGLIRSLNREGIRTDIVSVGDSNVLEAIEKHHLSLGGENSGHIILRDLLPTGDGLLNAFVLISILNRHPLEDLLRGYVSYPNRLESLTLRNPSVISGPEINSLFDSYRKSEKEDLFLNLRRSGTEGKIRIFVCHKDEFKMETILSKTITLLKILDSDAKVSSPEKVTIDKESVLGDRVQLIGECILDHARIGEGTVIRNSTVSHSAVGKNCTVGPYAHIRDRSEIGNAVRIGNFVELKHASIGDRTKISHLTYVGDCKCGKEVNFGCGCVTVNYDGKKKHETVIGNHVFIGCNTNLIAPIEIGDNVFIAAGSTVTSSVEKDGFVIARARQIVKEDGAKKYPYYPKEDSSCAES